MSGHGMRWLPDGLDLEAVAYRIARVIAEKSISADPRLSRLDALGRVSAAHGMAVNMVAMLAAEAEAAAHEVWVQLGKPERAAEESDERGGPVSGGVEGGNGAAAEGGPGGERAVNGHAGGGDL